MEKSVILELAAGKQQIIFIKIEHYSKYGSSIYTFDRHGGTPEQNITEAALWYTGICKRYEQGGKTKTKGYIQRYRY